MDRKVLTAMVLVMLVLLADQLLLPRFYRPKPKPGQPAKTQTAPSAPGGSGAGTGVAGDVPSGAPGGKIPSTYSSGAILTAPKTVAVPTLTREIQNDRFHVTFTSEGAAITSWVLVAYKDAVRKTPVDLVPTGSRAFQVLVEVGMKAIDFSAAPFALVQDDMAAGVLSFVAQDSSGVRVTKTYRLDPDSHLLDAEVRVSAPSELGPIRYRIGWGPPLPMTELYAKQQQIQGVAYLGTKLESVPASKLGPSGEKAVPPGNVRWIANRSKYFIAAVIPDSGTVSDVVFRSAGDGFVAAWMAGAAPPGSEVVRHSRIYAGPIHYETLLAVGSGLDEVANLGWQWMRPLSVLMLKLLNLLYKAIPNYGVGIIVLAAATKLIFYPLTQSSLRSMKVMHRLQPEVKAIQERHKEDPMKMNKMMMALYKEHKVNPMGGCLPMLLQVPVFIALYNVLLFSIELRASGFVGYIQDLSEPDVLFQVGAFSLHLMPIIMTASTFILQTQTPTAPNQKAMMYVMPFFMLFFMYTFPSGVILYWTVNNLLSALQQYLVNLADDRKQAAQA